MRRLLHDVDAADNSLRFWSARLKSGAHRSFLLLSQGPTSFVLDCVDLLRGRRRHRLGALKHPNATDQIERRVRAFPYTAAVEWRCPLCCDAAQPQQQPRSQRSAVTCNAYCRSQTRITQSLTLPHAIVSQMPSHVRQQSLMWPHGRASFVHRFSAASFEQRIV